MQSGPLDLVPVFVIAVLHAGYLAIFSTRAAVEEAARTYARQLLLSTEAPTLAKKAAAAPATKPAASAKATNSRKRKPKEQELSPSDSPS